MKTGFVIRPLPALSGLTMPSVKHVDLENGSDLLYFENFLNRTEAFKYLDSLNKELPWIRPILSVCGRNCEQPRETCYVADEGLPTYKYSGYQPIVYKWDDFPALTSIKNAVHLALPSRRFNSVLVNRYTNGSDYAGWHSDDVKLYGSSPTIASNTLVKRKENPAVHHRQSVATCKETGSTLCRSVKEQMGCVSILHSGKQHLHGYAPRVQLAPSCEIILAHEIIAGCEVLNKFHIVEGASLIEE
ncbi:hypothetical protein GOP47_0027106 [Adiantum capillus-veneris]|nr:hypothetical protein GOP47_0027106 [Adiantum capillus-veneris]